jgi:hypothetical protein
MSKSAFGHLAQHRRFFVDSAAYQYFGSRDRPHNTSRKKDRHDPSLHYKLPGLPK